MLLLKLLKSVTSEGVMRDYCPSDRTTSWLTMSACLPKIVLA